MLSLALWTVASNSLLQAVRRRARRRQSKFVELISADLTQCRVRFGSEIVQFQLTLPPDTIEPIFSGAAWAGTVVWPAAIFLANYLNQTNSCGGRVVIELGAGVGVPGIAAGLLGAEKVYLTEQPPLSDLLNINIKQASKLGRLEVFTFDWYEPPAKLVNECEVVLISDCIYEGLYGDSWKALASVLNDLLNSHETFALNSVERRKEDGIDSFITHCQEHYGIISELKREVITRERHIQLYEMRRQA
jgi:hypothetical protein